MLLAHTQLWGGRSGAFCPKSTSAASLQLATNASCINLLPTHLSAKQIITFLVHCCSTRFHFHLLGQHVCWKCCTSGLTAAYMQHSMYFPPLFGIASLLSDALLAKFKWCLLMLVLRGLQERMETQATVSTVLPPPHMLSPGCLPGVPDVDTMLS